MSHTPAHSRRIANASSPAAHQRRRVITKPLPAAPTRAETRLTIQFPTRTLMKRTKQTNGQDIMRELCDDRDCVIQDQVIGILAGEEEHRQSSLVFSGNTPSDFSVQTAVRVKS